MRRVFLIFIVAGMFCLQSLCSAEPGRLIRMVQSFGSVPFGLSWVKRDGKSLLYVMDYSAEGYQAYDTKNGTFATDIIKTGQGPRHGIVAVGNKYYAPYYEPATGNIVITSAEINKPYPAGLFTLKNAPWAFSITHDGQDFWAAGLRTTRKLFRFNEKGEILQTIDIGENIQSVAWGDNSLWVLENSGKIIRMDRSGKTTGVIELPQSLSISGDGRGITWDADTRSLWVSSGTGIWNIQAYTGVNAPSAVGASKINTSPVIDGIAEDRCWKQVPDVRSFSMLSGYGNPRNQTRIRYSYDNKNIYVLAQCEIRRGEKIKARKLKHDENVWDDESVELIFSPFADASIYYQIVVNAQGSVFDRKWGVGVADGAAWDSRATAACTRSHTGWTAEISIPVSVFSSSIIKGTVWRLQAFRNDMTLSLASSGLFPTVTGKYHDTAQFGSLIFSPEKVRISDYKIGDLFYGKLPIETSATNNDSKPVNVRLKTRLTDSRGIHSSIGQSFLIKPGETKLLTASSVINNEGSIKLEVQAENTTSGKILASYKWSPVVFDPLNMQNLQRMHRLTSNELKSLTSAHKMSFEKTFSELDSKLISIRHRLSSGHITSADKPRLVADVNALASRYRKLLMAGRATRTGWKNPDFIICSAYPTEQLFPDSPFSGNPVSEISMSMAKRESESMQLVVLPVRGDLREVQISSEAPVSSQGAKLGMEVSRVGFVNTVKPPTDVLKVGLWPDPLLKPVPFDVPSDELRCIWVRVSAPAGVPSGDYKGSVILTSAGSDPVKIAVKAHVWNIELPLKPYLRTAFALHLSHLANVYGSRHYEAFMNYTDEMLRNRIAPSYNSTKAWYPDINFSYKNKPEQLAAPGLWDNTEKYIEHCNTLGFSGIYDICYLDKMYDGTYPKDYTDATMRFLRSLVPDLKAKGLLDQVGIYAWDEIEPENYYKHVDIAKVIREEFPDLPILMVQNHGSAAEILKGYVDIWVPYITTYWKERDTYLKEQAQGRSVWWYICMYPFPGKLPCPNIYVDEPAIDLRMVHWMEYKFGVTGYLYWGINYWPDEQKAVVSEIDRSGILRWTTTEGTIIGNGEGYLFYPGPDLKPLLSMRMDNFRDGLEDYDMLMMLKKAVAEAPAGTDPILLTKARRLLQIPDDVVKTIGEYTLDINKIQEYRKQIAQTLEKLQ